MKNKKILDKVIKLLNLSENNSESAEAKSAKNMAAKLMAKHDISKIESTSESYFETDFIQLKRIKPAKYDRKLIHSVSRFNGVGFYIENGVAGITKAKYCFIGKQSDLEGNFYMIDILKQQRGKSWIDFREQHKANFKKPPVQRQHTNWHMGFALGVASKLKKLIKMKESKIQEYGLVPVDFSKQALNEIPGLSNINSKPAKYLESGFQTGKAAHIHKGLGKKTEVKMIKEEK